MPDADIGHGFAGLLALVQKPDIGPHPAHDFEHGMPGRIDADIFSTTSEPGASVAATIKKAAAEKSAGMRSTQALSRPVGQRMRVFPRSVTWRVSGWAKAASRRSV